MQLDNTAKISVQIISVNGRIIQTINKGSMEAGTYSLPLNLNNASAGMYIVRLMVNDKSYSAKILK